MKKTCLSVAFLLAAQVAWSRCEATLGIAPVKVRPYGAAPAPLKGPLVCARNEYCSFQVVVGATGDGCRIEDVSAGGFAQGVDLRTSLALEAIGKLHDQNPVLRDQPHQRDEADLRVDVDRREVEEAEAQRPGDGQRHRAEQHDQRIAEALELCRQHQIDEHHREPQRDGERPAFVADLSRFTAVIEGDAGAARRDRRLLEHAQALFLGDAGIDPAVNPHRIALLEAVQHAWRGAGLDARECGDRHELPVRRPDLEVEERPDGRFRKHHHVLDAPQRGHEFRAGLLEQGAAGGADEAVHAAMALMTHAAPSDPANDAEGLRTALTSKESEGERTAPRSAEQRPATAAGARGAAGRIVPRTSGL